jgi:hypothetical protein
VVLICRFKKKIKEENMATLANGKNTKSTSKVDGVNLKGISGVTYSTTTKVTVKNTTKDNIHHQIMTDQTNKNVELERGDYSVTNNSGGTIEYSWL